MFDFSQLRAKVVLGELKIERVNRGQCASHDQRGARRGHWPSGAHARATPPPQLVTYAPAEQLKYFFSMARCPKKGPLARRVNPRPNG